MSDDPRLLLTEVALDTVRFSTEAITGTVWKIVDHDGDLIAEEVTDPQVVSAMAAEARRRFLEAAVDERKLEAAVSEAWHGADPVPLDVPERWDVQDVVPEGEITAVVQTEVYPTAPVWCDIESLPPRTIDVTCEPLVGVEDDVVRVEVAAFGPAGRAPYTSRLLARFWSASAQMSLADVLLDYDVQTHRFKGTEPVFVVTDLSEWNHESADFLLDICGIHQGRPMARDEWHQRSWEQWQQVNRRWLADGEPVPGPAVTPHQSLPLVRVSYRGRWMLIDPLGADGDRGVPAQDWAVRRLGLIEFYRRVNGVLNARVGNALRVDRLLAMGALTDVRCDEADLQHAANFLLRTARLALAPSVSDQVRQFLADVCEQFVLLSPSEELTPLIVGLRMPRVVSPEPKPDKQPAIRDDAALQTWTVEQAWVAQRQAATARMLGVEPDGLDRVLLGAVAPNARRRLAAYPSASPADAPLLAEVIAARTIPAA